MDWPNDADGDVLRRLQSEGFDFGREVEVDFNVDFENWPPPDGAIRSMTIAMPQAGISMNEGGAYILVQIRAALTYPFVIVTQSELTQLARPYGGKCDSWGVWWDPRTLH